MFRRYYFPMPLESPRDNGAVASFKESIFAAFCQVVAILELFVAGSMSVAFDNVSVGIIFKLSLRCWFLVFLSSLAPKTSICWSRQIPPHPVPGYRTIYLLKFMVLIHQLNGLTDCARVGTTVQ
jgi:hypothetical protein